MKYRRKLKLFKQSAKRWAYVSVACVGLNLIALTSAKVILNHVEAHELPGMTRSATLQFDKLESPVKPRETPQKKVVSDCNLDFTSGKQSVKAPEWYVNEVKEFSCRDQKILSRLAFLESTYNRNAVNKHNKYATGLYQILPSSWTECKRNGKDGTDHLCALYHFNRSKARFEAYTRNTYLFNF